MKIVLNKKRPLILATVLSCVFVAGIMGNTSVAWAEIDPASVATTDAAPKVVPPPTDPAVAVAAPAVVEKEEKGAKAFNMAEDKVTDSAKSVVKRLGSADNVTLDDLNSARQTVAKIEALIDIEKHLNELDKIRSEHEGNHPSMSGAIPASALNAYQPPMQAAASMPMMMPMPMAASVVQTPMPTLSNIDVTRIIGGGGHFSAVIKGGDGQVKTVEVGDHVDGATVISIMSTGVELERNNSKRVVHVKNVQTVFGNTP